MIVPQTYKQSAPSRKRSFSTLINIALALCAITIPACQRQKESTPADSANRHLKVALLTPGPISDQSWNAGAYQGLLRIRDSLGAQVSHIQTKSPAEFEENFRQYGAQGYDLVFGHGDEFKEPAKAVGPSYPHTNYVITSGDSAQGNVSAMVFGFAAPSYLAGIIAGAMTRTNNLGVIGGVEIPPVRESFRAFAAGARSINPRVRVVSSFIGNWEDVSAGKEQALAQLARGVDVIFQNADAAGLGMFQAVREAKRAFIFGTNSNQNDVAPEVTLGSVVIDLPHALLSVGREVQNGAFKPRVITLGMREQVVDFVMNDALRKQIPEAARRAVDSVRAQIMKGTFTMPSESGRAAIP